MALQDIYGNKNPSGTLPTSVAQGGILNSSSSVSGNPLNNVWADTSRQYNDLVGAYRNLRENPSVVTKPSPYTFTPLQYNRSPELSQAFNLYQNFANTGGFSEGDIGNIRARSISPIRSIYSNANRDIDRQKVLSGGYSPNYGAVKSKLAREMSGQIGQKTSDTEAEIAQMVQSGKASALPGLSSLASSEAGNQRAIEAANQQMQMQIAQLNADAMRDYEARLAAQQGQQLQNVQSEQSLYGTSPAIASTFGNQFLSSANPNSPMNNFNRENTIGPLRTAFGTVPTAPRRPLGYGNNKSPMLNAYGTAA